MRGLTYAVAVIAAIGIMIGIANMPPESTPTSAAPGTVVLNVPNMHCEFSCFPLVKETLESSTTVASVELAPQKEEGTIDNRQIVVNHNPGFDAEEAIGALTKAGFADSSLASTESVQ